MIGQAGITICSWTESRFNSSRTNVSRVNEKSLVRKESQRGKWILGRIKHLISTILSIVDFTFYFITHSPTLGTY